jgi:hypothetical protein
VPDIIFATSTLEVLVKQVYFTEVSRNSSTSLNFLRKREST